jgi:hypothetical protein
MGTKPATPGFMFVLTAVFLAASFHADGQSTESFNSLFVYGHGYAFQVREPEGWRGDIKRIAAQHAVDAIFLPFSGIHSGDVSIRVKVTRKIDDNTIEDMNHDLQFYASHYPGAPVKNLGPAPALRVRCLRESGTRHPLHLFCHHDQEERAAYRR